MAVTSKRQTKSQPINLRLESAKLNSITQLIAAVNSIPSSSEALFDVHNAIIDVANCLTPVSTEKLAERISDIVETEYLQEAVLPLVNRIGWALADGWM